MHLIGMRQGVPAHPGALVEADRVDHQRVALIVADRVTEIAGHEIFACRMRPSVQVDRSEGMGAALQEQVDPLASRQIQQLDAVGRRERARTG